MHWPTLFARRSRHMHRSSVRELLKLTARPGVISFAGGLPGADLFPLDAVREAAGRVLARAGRAALQYSATEGLGELREWIARRVSTPSWPVSREQVAILSGAQQGLDLVGRVLLNAGDPVVVENPTYLALLSAWRPLGVRFLPVSTDQDGMRVDALEACAQACPKLIYSIPNFHNPQGTTLSLERRLVLSQWLARRERVVLEDDPYGELRYEGEPLPSLAALCPDRVIHLGTFSKILMPGLRVGWAIAPEPVIEKLIQAKQSADLQTSTFNQHLAWELIQDGFLERHVPFLREQYRARRDAMLHALHRYLPAEATWTRPQGGMFLMLRLPCRMDGAQLLTRALTREKVAFVPGSDFHLRGAGRDTIRLNFTQARPEVIEEGIQRLGRVVCESLTSPLTQRSADDGVAVSKRLRLSLAR